MPTKAQINAWKDGEAKFLEKWGDVFEVHLNNENREVAPGEIRVDYALIGGLRLTYEDLQAIDRLAADKRNAAMYRAYGIDVPGGED